MRLEYKKDLPYDPVFYKNIFGTALGKSPLLPYLINAETDPEQYDCLTEAQAEVFESESSVALSFALKEGSPCRTEDRSLFIVKVLLFIGVRPNGNSIAVLASIIENLSFRQDLDVDDVIEFFANTHETTVSAVTRIIEKSLNVYDAELFDRVERLTGTKPLTSKDVISDLSLYIRLDYTAKKGGQADEQHR